jgi:hypothetical protein
MASEIPIETTDFTDYTDYSWNRVILVIRGP